MITCNEIHIGVAEDNTPKIYSIQTVLLLSVLITLFFSENLYSQIANDNYERRQYVVKNWDNTNGLPQNSAYSITKNKTGFLWLGTEEGLVRFDGTDFVVYDQKLIPELESTDFLDLEPSSGGGVWGVSEQDIVRVQDDHIERFSINNYSRGLISDIAESKSGTLWVGTNLGEVLRYVDNTLKRVEEWQRENHGAVLKIESTGNLVYVGTTTGLYKINESTGIITNIDRFRGKQIRSIFVRNQKDLWVGTDEDGIFHLSEKDTLQYTTDHGLRENSINDVFVSELNEVWAATISSGLYRLENNTFIPFDNVKNLGQSIREIFISEDGIIWIGTSGSGLYQLKPADIYSLPVNEELSSPISLPIYQHDNGSVWIGTAGGGLNKVVGNTVTHYTRSDGLNNEVILSVYGTENYIYVGTANGLYRLNLNTNSVDKSYTTKEGLSSNLVQAIYESSKGELWIATREGGIHKLSDNRIEKISVPEELSKAKFNNIFEDSNGKIWLGTDGMGAICLSGRDLTNHFTREDGLPSNIVFDFYEDKHGAIWLATYEGLSVINGDSIISYGMVNNLDLDEIYAIAEDKNGYIWMSSNKGLLRIDGNDLLVAKEDPQYLFSSRLFTQEHGMPNSETNGGIYPASWNMKNGDIWFPTVNGVAVVKPDLFGSSVNPVNIVFESLRFAGEKVSGEKNIMIPAGVSYIEAEFTSIDFINPSDIQYSYRIAEIDISWNEVGNQTSISLALQNPGTYTFEVRAEKNGIYSKIASQTFTVQPFFYQTLWFKVITVFFLIGLGYLFNQLWYVSQRSKQLGKMVDQRTKTLNATLNEKTILLQEIHHRVKNNLAIVSGLLELQMMNGKGSGNGNAVLWKSINRIKAIALVHEQLYKAESLAAINLREYFNSLVQSIISSSEGKNHINVNYDIRVEQININQAVTLGILTNELITNSLKYAFDGNDSGEISITIKPNNTQFYYKYSDTGKGFDFEKKKESNSFGIELITTMVKQLTEEFDISSTNGFAIEFSFEERVRGSHSNI